MTTPGADGISFRVEPDMQASSDMVAESGAEGQYRCMQVIAAFSIIADVLEQAEWAVAVVDHLGRTLYTSLAWMRLVSGDTAGLVVCLRGTGPLGGTGGTGTVDGSRPATSPLNRQISGANARPLTATLLPLRDGWLVVVRPALPVAGLAPAGPLPFPRTFADQPAPDAGSDRSADVSELERVEAALRISDERFCDFALTSSDWFWETDVDDRFTWFSPNIGQRTGLSSSRLLGRTRRELAVDDADTAKWRRYQADLNARRPFRNLQYRVRTDQGEETAVRVSGVPVFSPDGEFLGYRGVGCNVTAQAVIEERAERAQQLLFDAIESIGDGFALFNAQDRLVLCNESYRTALADIADVLLPGARFEDVLNTQAARGSIRVRDGDPVTWAKRALAERRLGPAMRCFQTNRGGWIEEREYTTHDGGRVVIRADVTQRKRGEELLQSSQASLLSAQRIAHIGNWNLRVRSNEMNWSEEVFRIFGLDRRLTAATYEGFLDSIHPHDCRTVNAAIHAALYDGATYVLEHRLLRPDGSERIVVQEGEVTFDAEGLPLVMIGTIQDITDRRTAERQMIESEQRFRMAFETSADAIAIFALPDGRFVDVNAAFTRLFGHRKEDAIGRTTMQLGLWRSAAERDAVINLLIRKRELHELDIEFFDRDGRPRSMLTSASLCELDGQPHVLANMRDVTELRRVELELRKLWRAVEQSSAAVLITNAEGSIEYVNPMFTEVTGYLRHEVVGRSPGVLKSGLTPCRVYAELWAAMEAGLDWHGEFCNRRKDGSFFWVSTSISPVKGPHGRTTHYIGVQSDVTERKRSEQELRASEERFRSLVETSLLGICIERDGRPLFVNQTLVTMFGYDSASEMLALGAIDALYVRSDLPRLRQYRRTYEQAGLAPQPIEVRGLRKDGSAIWLLAQIKCIPWNDGAAVQTSVVDITLRKGYEDRLHRQANFDPVTDLPNRTLALDRLGAAIRTARRRGSCIGVLFIDVDHFKKINDTLGHASGDSFLRELADRMQATLRSGDTVARLGGDEFLIVLPDVVDRRDTETVAWKIIEAATQPFIIDGLETFVSISVGVSLFPFDGNEAEALVQHADAAMYMAKSSGRGTLRFFMPELLERSQNRIRLEGKLRHALSRGELNLAFQPLVCINTGRVLGAEALLRWKTPEWGELAPDRFVQLAEDTGLIVPIGEWVIDTGCAHAQRWIKAGHTQVRLAVNVSSRQFHGPSLVSAVQRALAANAMAPDYLELEITESLLMEDMDEITDTLRALEACGVHIAVDDFGTGYSSLSYLNRFPLDTLKIDRSFTSGMLVDSGRGALVDALIALAHRLDLRVIAEGVETQAQLDFLRSCRCDLAQGFLFSRPLDPDSFLRLLESWPATMPKPEEPV